MVRPSWVEEAPRQGAEQGSVRAQERQGHCDALGHGGSGAALRHALPVGFGGALLAHLREVVLPRGRVDVGEQCGALAQERHPPPQEFPGGPHRGGRARGLGEHAAPEQDCAPRGSDAIVLRFAPMARRHGAGMPEDERHLSAEGGAPIPGDQTCDGLTIPAR
jgi:hypothetical protein